MKKKIISILMVVLLVSLTACGSKDAAKNSNTGKDNADAPKTETTENAEATADSGKKEKVRIVLDWTPNTNHTGLYVAQEKGFFEQAGLEVEIMQPPEGSTTALVATGGAEFGISFQDTIAPSLASDAPMPITAVATLIQHNTSGIVSLKKSGIDSPSKLAGHSYATWEDPIELAMIKYIVEQDGGKYEDVKLIPNTVTDVVTALQTDVESVWIYYAWDGIATEVAGLETNYLKFADYGSELDYYTPVLIGNNDYIKNNSETTKKLLDAIKQGYEFAIDNPDEAADILLKSAPELDEKLVKASQKWISTQYKADVEQWGYIDPVRWDGFYSWLYKNKLIEKEIPAGTGFTNDYLSK